MTVDDNKDKTDKCVFAALPASEIYRKLDDCKKLSKNVIQCY